MAMSHVVDPDPIDQLAAREDAQVVQVSMNAVGAITKSEVEAQLDAAHKYPRSITRFLQEASNLACLTVEIAESCIYSLPRDGKTITGPSVRLAEICASAYGNLHVGARVLDAEEKEIVSQGVAWDLQKNLRATIEVRRRITGRNGRRYSDDMVTTTGNAGASIALRNAIFRVIPRAYVNQIYDKARKVAVGDAKTLVNKRGELLDRLLKLGVTQDRVLLRLEKTGVEDIGVADLEVLIGLGTAIKQGETTIDEAFPAPAPSPAAPADDGKRMKIGSSKQAAPSVQADREPGED